MEQNDYTFYIISNFLNYMDSIVNLKKAANYEGALQITSEAYFQLLGVDSLLLNSLEDTDLINFFSYNGVLNRDKAIIAGSLLKNEGDIYRIQNNLDESYQRYLKALQIYLEAYRREGETHLTGFFVDVERIMMRIGRYELPMAIKELLLDYYEKEGHYKKAESLLEELAIINNLQQYTLVQGLFFYQRLLQKSDRELSTGKLSREQAEEGFNRLVNRFKQQNIFQ